LRRIIGCLLLIGLGSLGACYFPNKNLEAVRPDKLEKGKTIPTPTKVHLRDGTIILFQSGFVATEAVIKGEGRRFELGQPSKANLEAIEVPLDRIAAMTYCKDYVTTGGWVGTAILDATSWPLTALSVYCLFCPKCCFGSCPTVYVRDNDEFKLTAELFSFSVGSLMESDDLDLLAGPVGSSDRPFEMRVTNEALESHFINYLRPEAVVHPRKTLVYPDAMGQPMLFRRFLSPEDVRNSQGEDVRESVSQVDQRLYRSPRSLVERLKDGPFFDYLDLKMKVPASATSVKLLLRMRNTLLTTLLFYDMVLGSQGLDALAWTERMNTDPSYAGRFWSLYRLFSGIRVKVRTDTGWVAAGLVHDPGPIAFKRLAVRVPTFGREEVEVRLEFVPDNFMIDAVSFDYDEGPAVDVAVHPLEFDQVTDVEGRLRPDIQALVADKDDRYLDVEPGQAYRFVFDPPAPRSDEEEVSVFIASRGYYNEWLRGTWLTSRPDPGYRFDLGDVGGTLRRLAESWLSSKEMLEERFFKTRIPIRGER